MRGLRDDLRFGLLFKVVRKQFSKILAVIIIIFMNILQEEDHPVTEVYLTCLTAAQNGINNITPAYNSHYIETILDIDLRSLDDEVYRKYQNPITNKKE